MKKIINLTCKKMYFNNDEEIPSSYDAHVEKIFEYSEMVNDTPIGISKISKIIGLPDYDENSDTYYIVDDDVLEAAIHLKRPVDDLITIMNGYSKIIYNNNGKKEISYGYKFSFILHK